MNKETLKQIIIDTIKGEEHLGENLKNQCVDYIKQLYNNWNKLEEYLLEKEDKSFDGKISFDDILIKMQELEQGSDSNE